MTCAEYAVLSVALDVYWNRRLPTSVPLGSRRKVESKALAFPSPVPTVE